VSTGCKPHGRGRKPTGKGRTRDRFYVEVWTIYGYDSTVFWCDTAREALEWAAEFDAKKYFGDEKGRYEARAVIVREWAITYREEVHQPPS
jgi:hypothetical protein